ncbi:MAG: hypothetical protein K8S98_18995, partial [Planctomycetes bacterium]|nr:hypothetical protein [Planctomycetota bacterium]
QDILEPSPIPPMIAAARFASCAVRLHLIRGESEAALDALREDFEIARVASGLPLIPGFDAWGFDLGIALTGLRESLQFLPPSTDLSWYEHELDGIDPRAVLVRAVRQDRLAGHNTIRAFTGAGLPDERRDSVDTLQAWLARRFLLIDHGVYLESFRRALEHLESEHWREAPTRPFEAKAPWPASHYQAMSRLLTPEFERHIDYAMELEAKVALARAALVNHRDGTNAARAWLAARSDPFDGAPLRSRVDPDGVLVMWSIGHDRVDDGAPRRSNRCESGPFVDVDWLVLAR